MTSPLLAAWMDGHLVPADQATLAVTDPAVTHGAAVFTTLRGYEGRVFMLEEHCQRLETSAAQLGLPVQPGKTLWSSAVAEVLKHASGTLRIRLMITGSGRQVVTAQSYTPLPESAIHMGVPVTWALPHHLNALDPRAGHKASDYFGRLLVLERARKEGFAEAIWVDHERWVVSGCVSNLLLVRGSRLLTPATREELDGAPSAVLPGITRRVVFKLARKLGLRVECCEMSIGLVEDSDEAMLTNSLMGVVPVASIGKVRLQSHLLESFTQSIALAYAKLVEAKACVPGPGRGPAGRKARPTARGRGQPA